MLPWDMGTFRLAALVSWQRGPRSNLPLPPFTHLATYNKYMGSLGFILLALKDMLVYFSTSNKMEVIGLITNTNHGYS
jgi:hypothetical protein